MVWSGFSHVTFVDLRISRLLIYMCIFILVGQRVFYYQNNPKNKLHGRKKRRLIGPATVLKIFSDEAQVKYGRLVSNVKNRDIRAIRNSKKTSMIDTERPEITFSESEERKPLGSSLATPIVQLQKGHEAERECENSLATRTLVRS